MPRRPTTKAIHYVRAIYNPNAAPQQSLEQLIRDALTSLSSVAQTESTMSTLGVVSVRHRSVDVSQPLCLAIGAGVPGEQMATQGVGVLDLHDADHTTDAPESRAFKHSDAYILIEENDLLLVTEGSFRVPTVGAYLELLIAQAQLGNVVFELRKVTNQDARATLDREGIKELRLNTTMYRATQELDTGHDGGSDGIGAKIRSLVSGLKDRFIEDMSDEQNALLAQHWGELQVSTVIKANGGSRAEDIVLDVIRDVGEGVLSEADNSVDVTVITQKGSSIRLGDVTPVKKVKLFRREGANELINIEIYEVLTDYREELRGRNLWRR